MSAILNSERRFGPVVFLPGANRGRYPGSNSLFLPDAGVLIDAGADAACCNDLAARGAVREIWLSHWHEDHLTHLDSFPGARLRQSALEAEPLADLEAFLDWYGIERPDYRAHWRRALVEDFGYRPRRADAYFAGGEVVDLGACAVEVIATPGHTPGHLAFFVRECGLLFLGDYDLTPFGPWYGDRDSDIDQLIASLRRLRAIDARVWLASHEEGCFDTPPGELFDRYLGVIATREARLLDFLRERPRTLDQIAGQHIVYRKPRQPAAFFDWGERALMGKHLARLIAAGAVAKDGDAYVRL